jgi:glycosyltransferase involved in cell wall biosynthesis
MFELSVIIPTYNRADDLRACLEALERQTQAHRDYEVIVVIDGGTDCTHEMLGKLATPYALRVIYQQNSGAQVARNFGVENACGRYCVFLDDDIIPDRRFLSEHLRVQRQHDRAVAIGQISISVPTDADWFLRCFARQWSSHYARLNEDRRPPSWQDCYAGNMSVSREDFLKAGGFAADLPRGHDVELGYRLEQYGLSIVYVRDAIGTQYERKGMRELTADAEKRGAVRVKLYERHPSMLPHLLGNLSEASRREIFLHRILLGFNISPTILAVFGPLLPRRSWAYSWYRFLYSYCYWRGVRRAIANREMWRRLTRGTVILMYHAIGDRGESASRYVVPVRRFKLQMAFLKRMGYRVLKLEEFIHYMREHRLPPARSVVITLDDGYSDARTLAWPILQQLGLSATVFVVSGKVGASNDWTASEALRGRRLLSWSEIRELVDGGMQLGAHTRTHPILSGLPVDRVAEEILGARTDLERKLQIQIRTLAYPHGEYNSATVKVAIEAGFLGSCSVHDGWNTAKTPLHALRRIEIQGTDSLVFFALKLWLGHSRIGRHRRRWRRE